MKSDIPPEYTNKSSDNYEDEFPPDFSTLEQHELPEYFQTTKNPGWTIVINNRFWLDGFRIFVSLDAAYKFSIFKKNKTPEIIDLQEQGFGVPILKAITPNIPFTNKFLTFRRYVPTNLHPFDIDKDYYEYCTVKKTIHVGYDAFIFEFKPDPNVRKSDFTITMFSHSQLPINDYIYKGNKHRWVDETHGKGFRKRWSMKFGFKHTVLRSDQLSLTDNWDGKSDKLNKTINKNPYLEGYLKKMFSVSARLPKHEYYGNLCSDTLGETEQFFKTGYAELKIDDIANPNSNVNYETIFSLTEDHLVTICIATVLKRQKDIEEDRKRSSSGGGGGG